MVPFYLLLLAGCGAHWPDCEAVIDQSHSSVSLSSVKSSARSATVNTDASECFMAVALWLEVHHIALDTLLLEAKMTTIIIYTKLTQN